MDENAPQFAAISYYQKRIRVGERLTFLLRVYGYIGIIAVIFGSGFLLYSKLKINLTTDETLALGIAFTGAFISVLSFGFLSYRKAIYDRDVARFAEHQTVGRFIDAWARFEEASSVAAFGGYSDEKRFNLRETLKRLKADGRLSVGDQIVADELLQIRNSLVHGTKRFPNEEIEKAIGHLVSLITKIS